MPFIDDRAQLKAEMDRAILPAQELQAALLQHGDIGTRQSGILQGHIRTFLGGNISQNAINQIIPNANAIYSYNFTIDNVRIPDQLIDPAIQSYSDELKVEFTQRKNDEEINKLITDGVISDRRINNDTHNIIRSNNVEIDLDYRLDAVEVGHDMDRDPNCTGVVQLGDTQRDNIGNNARGQASAILRNWIGNQNAPMPTNVNDLFTQNKQISGIINKDGHWINFRIKFDSASQKVIIGFIDPSGGNENELAPYIKQWAEYIAAFIIDTLDTENIDTILATGEDVIGYITPIINNMQPHLLDQQLVDHRNEHLFEQNTRNGCGLAAIVNHELISKGEVKIGDNTIRIQDIPRNGIPLTFQDEAILRLENAIKIGNCNNLAENGGVTGGLNNAGQLLNQLKAINYTRDPRRVDVNERPIPMPWRNNLDSFRNPSIHTNNIIAPVRPQLGTSNKNYFSYFPSYQNNKYSYKREYPKTEFIRRNQVLKDYRIRNQYSSLPNNGTLRQARRIYRHYSKIKNLDEREEYLKNRYHLLINKYSRILKSTRSQQKKKVIRLQINRIKSCTAVLAKDINQSRKKNIYYNR